MKRAKLALFQSVVALLLCCSMLIGTTFAWFSDSEISAGNIIQTGKLKIGLEWKNDLSDEAETWKDASEGALFNYEFWEPGYTDLKYLKVSNVGNLAFQYQLSILPADAAVGASEASASDAFKLAEAIDVYYAEIDDAMASREDAATKLTKIGTLSDLITSGLGAVQGILLPTSGSTNVTLPAGVTADKGETTACIMLKMRETAGNEYMGLSAGDGFCVQVLATQYTYENDMFGNDFDTKAAEDELKDMFTGSVGSVSGSAEVDVADGKTTAEVQIGDGEGGATIPAGVQVAEGATELTLTITEKAESDANVTLGAGEALLALDVHIEGVAEDNTVPMVIALGKVLPPYMNLGNVALYHVEDATTAPMTQVSSLDELDTHNEFYYDVNTGNVTIAIATFSEIALTANEDNVWNGEFDYTWYDRKSSPYTIANADQLAAFGAIVGGMAEGFNKNSFAGQTVKLLADINLADAEESNDSNKIFYPIGYYNSTGSYEKKSGDPVTSSVSSFEGTFDGAGHTISNFYQNTWEMFGDYNDGYSGTPNHYKDAMGLFGYVVNGTVKNLTVSNFSSDGEFTPTGVIAAFAVNSNFENIAITNCNPRVYNTGNGGIIGIAGDSNGGDSITLTNITVDNSNKISALWGSWDVACGGLVGMFRGNDKDSTISFTNCHVSAQIDVYNDVCANYQYYAYRYAGMIIGSVRNNATNEDGKTIPNMTGISAKGCTVNYGDWNDYYYCEFEKNSMASYSEDYQFSRVPHSELKFTDSNGNGVVDAAERASVTGCKHDHTAEENHQAIYLPFHQLFTGYSWGVSSIGLKEYSGIVTDLGITEGDQEESVEKFKINLSASEKLDANVPISVGYLFAEISDAKINASAVQVSVSELNNSGITATFTKSNTDEWEKGTLTFNKTDDMCTVTIQDYNFCKPTSFVLKDGKLCNIFEKKFTGDFCYRIGNGNAVALSSLFKTMEGVEIGNVDVTIEPVRGTATGTYTANAAWDKGTIQFTGNGIVTVTITDDKYSPSTVLKLEVVDAVNATSATNATENNVVLLNDVGFSSLTVSGGYTLYGNGFTMTCASDSAALDMGYSFVTLNNGTLDNVQIVCPNFDYAVLYKSNMTESGNRSETTDKTRYYNVKSGVMASGNSQILNSRISGARAAVNVSGGNVVIDNSRIELGAVASILVGAANSLTLRDVTLVQKPTASTYDSTKTLMGFSVLAICDAEGNSAPITLEGTLVQNAWVDENDKQYVPSAGQNIIQTVLGKTEYLHDLDGNGTKESLNLGFAYMPESLTSKVNTTTITDNRTNKDDVPYDYAEVSILTGKTYVYSYKNTNGTGDNFKTESEYTPDKYGDIIVVTYTDTADGLTIGKSFGADGWVYELNVDLDKLSDYKLDFSKLSMSVNGVTVTDFKVNGNDKPASPVVVTAGGTTYTLTATVNGKEYTATYKVTGTETSKESPSLVASNYEAGLCVASSHGGTWHGAAPALQGIQIKYWSVAEKQYKTINLSDYTPTTTGQLNGTNTTWTYSPANGDFTLTLTGGQVHSSNNVYAMPVVCAGKLYFVAAKSNGLVNSGNSARTIPVSYTFKDNNNGDVLTFSHTWSVAENKEAQYKYSDFCNGTLTKLEASSGGGCVTPDTLITLANGKQVRVDSLTVKEELLVWNMETGKLDSAPILFLDHDPQAEYEVIHLYFSDGTDVKVISEHGFWDYDLNRYVYLDRNAASYIGHTFAKQNGADLTKVRLTNVVLETESTTAWSPVTEGHLCYFVNGMLSMPGGVGGLFNIFDVNPDTMTYDFEAMAQDIQRYGLYTYEELNAIAPLPEAMFDAAGGAFMKISIGKGNLTMDELTAMINRYTKFFE